MRLCGIREIRFDMNLGKIFLGAYEENQRGELVSRIRQEHPDLLALRFSDFRVCGERARPESRNRAWTSKVCLPHAARNTLTSLPILLSSSFWAISSS
jgi:hypothetical protein